MPVINDRLLQRIRRTGAICFSFLTLAGCAGLPFLEPAIQPDPASLEPAPLGGQRTRASAPLDLITVNATRKPLPIAVTPAPVGPPDLLHLLADDFALSYEQNRRIEAQRDWYVRHPDYLARVFTRS